MSLATMIINLIARTDEFESGMNRSENRVRSFDKTIRSFDSMDSKAANDLGRV